MLLAPAATCCLSEIMTRPSEERLADCPHHTEDSQGQREGQLREACEGRDYVLVSLLGVVGLPQMAINVVEPLVASQRIGFATTAVVSVFHPPPFHPPRL